VIGSNRETLVNTLNTLVVSTLPYFLRETPTSKIRCLFETSYYLAVQCRRLQILERTLSGKILTP
jgi:hypothetical protein